MRKCKLCGGNLSNENYAGEYACVNPNCSMLGIYLFGDEKHNG